VTADRIVIRLASLTSVCTGRGKYFNLKLQIFRAGKTWGKGLRPGKPWKVLESGI